MGDETLWATLEREYGQENEVMKTGIATELEEMKSGRTFFLFSELWVLSMDGWCYFSIICFFFTENFMRNMNWLE